MINYSCAGLADPFSSLSHIAGACICIPGAVSLFRATHNRNHRIAITVYCFGCVFLLLASGVYHLLPLESASRAVLQRIDHAAIFILIAGTFTPIHAIVFNGFWRWAPLFAIWTVAITGIVLKTIFFAKIPEMLSVSVYLGMGWSGVLSGFLVWRLNGFEFIRPLLNGALWYSGGSLLDFFHEPILINGIIGPHELFHIAVLFGITYHWKFIRNIIQSHGNPAPILGSDLIPLPA